MVTTGTGGVGTWTSGALVKVLSLDSGTTSSGNDGREADLRLFAGAGFSSTGVWAVAVGIGSE